MISRQAIARVRNAHAARRLSLARALSSRASAVLGALDIPADSEVPGVYDGAWAGSGEVLESVCPATGEVLARVKSVRLSAKRVARVCFNMDPRRPRKSCTRLLRSRATRTATSGLCLRRNAVRFCARFVRR